MKFSGYAQKADMQGNVCQIFYLCLSLNLSNVDLVYEKNTLIFPFFAIKLELGP